MFPARNLVSIVHLLSKLSGLSLAILTGSGYISIHTLLKLYVFFVYSFFFLFSHHLHF